jgi:hypothetical protein
VRLKEIATDVELGEEGEWVTMTGGWRAQVRSTQCKGYRKRAAKHLHANRRFYIRKQSPPPEVTDKQALECVVEELLVGWSGIEDDDIDGPIPFSKEKAYEILGDPRYKVMLDDVADAAGEFETFRFREVEEDLGN